VCDVVGVGANSLDRVYRLPVYPEPSGPASKLRIEHADRSAGGQTATVLAGCAALGLRTAYVGTFSDGEDGAFVRAALRARGVNTTHALLRQGPNPYAVILIAAAAPGAASGERIVLWDRPSSMRLAPEDVPADLVASARLVFVDDVDIDAAIAAANAARPRGVPVVTDIEQPGGRVDALIAAATVPVFAEHVPQALTGESNPERALRALRRRHEGMLCVTLGARGAALLDGDEFLSQPAFPVRAVDTTGAGDVFRAAFIFALLRGDDSSSMLRFACAAAAVSCTRPGAIASVPALDEIQQLLLPR